jgi:hexokinase
MTQSHRLELTFGCTVTDVPSGKETGTFLAMDLGGTNIRACSVELKGDGTFDMIQSKTVVPPELQTAKSSTELFGFIADHLQHFLTKYHPEHCERDHKDLSKAYRLGFTFSFPVIQTSINSGKLLRWTKGFQIEVRPLFRLVGRVFMVGND